MTEGEH
jgi:hypothetical protein